MTYRIGIDAGSKTLKVIVLDESGDVVYSTYMRHRANIARTLKEAIHDLNWRLGELDATIAITGSAAIEIANMIQIPFVQEVAATTYAVRKLIPQADVAIELGGEDAKIIYLTDGLEQRMNATCAGGTGGFIDNIAYMLDVRSSQMSSLAYSANRTYPIASRCAVFAQTDVRPLLNAGASKADIAASTFDAVVRQTLGGLACGRPIHGTVAFLGGPLEHMPYLVNSFAKALDLTPEQRIKPVDAHLFTVRGTALLSDDGAMLGTDPVHMNTGELLSRIENMGDVESDMEHLPALFESEQELEEFQNRHARASFPRANFYEAKGPLYLGIDAGSTTLKLVAINDAGEIVLSAYEPIKGDLIETLREMLQTVYARIDPPSYLPHAEPKMWIERACATGYGEELLRAAFGVDMGVVETAAHLRAARELCPDVSFLLDIGGQDMKALWVKQGVVVDAALNEACSSGCGAFIEGTAAALKSTPWQFSKDALIAENPIDLGTKCTVFMSSRVKHAQKIGAQIEDIAAGVAYSVVKNALHRIIGADRMPTQDDRVVVQGGTFKSDAVLRAFEKLTGIEAIRPEQTHLMGAIGCALFARDIALAERSDLVANVEESSSLADRSHSSSALISADELATMRPQRSKLQCTGCPNGCMLSVVTFDEDGSRYFISDNKCDRGLQELERRNAEESSSLADRSHPSSGNRSAAAELAGKDRPLKQSSQDRLVISEALRSGRREELSSADQVADFSFADRSHPSSGNHPAPNLVAREQQLIASFGDLTQDGPRGDVRVGLLDAMEMYANKPFWHTLLKELGFSIVVPQPGCESDQASEAWETVPSESVCYPAKTSHLRYFSLCEKDATAALMIHFDRGNHCPVQSGYARALMQNAASAGRKTKLVPLIAPELINYKPRVIASDLGSLETLRRALNLILEEGRPDLPEIGHIEFAAAFRIALEAQESFLATLEAETIDALHWLEEDPSRHGIVLVGRPYHTDEALMHGIDRVLSRLGFAVFGAAGLSNIVRAYRKKQYNGSYPWKPAKRLVRLANFTAEHPQLDAVFLESFGCGFEAISLEEAKDILDAAGKPCTVLKIDDISDLAHIRIRLRTLAATIEMRSVQSHVSSGFAQSPALTTKHPNEPARASASEVKHSNELTQVALSATYGDDVASNWQNHEVLAAADRSNGKNEELWQDNANSFRHSSPKVPGSSQENAIARQKCQNQLGERPQLAESAADPHIPHDIVRVSLLDDIFERPLELEDLEIERRDCIKDVCFTANVMAARIIRMLRENPAIELIELPDVCNNCLTEAIPRMVERATGLSPDYISVPWKNSVAKQSITAGRYQDPQAAKAQQAYDGKACDGDPPNGGATIEASRYPERIGIIGNPLMCFEPFMNDDIVAKLEDLGCEPVMPDPALICSEDIRYLEQLRAFEEQGINDVVYLLSFGCLKAHVNVRGALHELKQLFPDMRITVIDYDPESSALNRENRLRLAVESARLAAAHR